MSSKEDVPRFFLVPFGCLRIEIGQELNDGRAIRPAAEEDRQEREYGGLGGGGDPFLCELGAAAQGMNMGHDDSSFFGSTAVVPI
jgi:hypothetical protein